MNVQCSMEPICLTVSAKPCFARLVRMTAANVAMLSNMSVDRVEDIRMAAEEAFVYTCSETPNRKVSITFMVNEAHVEMTFKMESDSLAEVDQESPSRMYADLIMTSVCDIYEKREQPACLYLDLRADA